MPIGTGAEVSVTGAVPADPIHIIVGQGVHRSEYSRPFLHALESDPALDQQKAHRARCVVRNLSEVRRSWVQIRHVELRFVEHIQSIHSELEARAVIHSKRALNVRIHPVQPISPASADACREHPCLERCRLLRGTGDESGSVKPAIQRLRPGTDAAQVSVVKKISPVEQRTGLCFESGRNLPSADDRI
jgi:hypothetical protein